MVIIEEPLQGTVKNHIIFAVAVLGRKMKTIHLIHEVPPNEIFAMRHGRRRLTRDVYGKRGGDDILSRGRAVCNRFCLIALTFQIVNKTTGHDFEFFQPKGITIAPRTRNRGRDVLTGPLIGAKLYIPQDTFFANATFYNQTFIVFGERRIDEILTVFASIFSDRTVVGNGF